MPNAAFTRRPARRLLHHPRSGPQRSPKPLECCTSGPFHFQVLSGFVRPLVLWGPAQRGACTARPSISVRKGYLYMLILSRRLNEAILLPGLQTSIRGLAVRADTVRRGVEAPADVSILREEVPERAAGWGPIGTLPPGQVTEAKLHQLNLRLQSRLDSAED